MRDVLVERPEGVSPHFERCRECKNWLPLDDKQYVVSHRVVYANGAPTVTPMRDITDSIRYDMNGYPCIGGQKRSLEWKIRAFEKRWAGHDAAVREVALDAGVAYDALMDGKPVDVERYLKLAIDEYKRRHGATWLNRTGPKHFVTSRCVGGDWKNHKMDVYCTLCRGLLMPRISTAANPDAFPKVKRHAFECALLCLSGRQEYMPPEHRGLILADRAFAD